jgi:hypothetical protein
LATTFASNFLPVHVLVLPFPFKLKLAFGGGPGVAFAGILYPFWMASSGLLSCSGMRDGAGKNVDEDFRRGFSRPGFGDFGDFGCFAVSNGGKTNGVIAFIVIVMVVVIVMVDQLETRSQMDL